MPLLARRTRHRGGAPPPFAAAPRPAASRQRARQVLGGGRRGQWRRSVLRRALAVLALIAAIGVAADLLRPHPPESRSALTAARDLPAGHRLTVGDLRAVTVPADLPAADHLALREELVDRVLATTVARGELLSRTRLVPRGTAEGLPAGTSPLHVVVSDPRMLDLVTPGQRVRVHRARTGGLVAHDVLVVGVDAPREESSLIGGESGGERGLVLALPVDVIDAALATPEPDGLVPRMHVVPTSDPPTTTAAHAEGHTAAPTPAGEG